MTRLEKKLQGSNLVLPTCRRMALIFEGSRKDFASADWEVKCGSGGGNERQEGEGKKTKRSGMELRIWVELMEWLWSNWGMKAKWGDLVKGREKGGQVIWNGSWDSGYTGPRRHKERMEGLWIEIRWKMRKERSGQKLWGVIFYNPLMK